MPNNDDAREALDAEQDDWARLLQAIIEQDTETIRLTMNALKADHLACRSSLTEKDAAYARLLRIEREAKAVCSDECASRHEHRLDDFCRKTCERRSLRAALSQEDTTEGGGE